MTDLITELRNPSKAMSDKNLGDLCRESADEIERLRKLIHDAERELENVLVSIYKLACQGAVHHKSKWPP